MATLRDAVDAYKADGKRRYGLHGASMISGVKAIYKLLNEGMAALIWDQERWGFIAHCDHRTDGHVDPNPRILNHQARDHHSHSRHLSDHFTPLE